jgi:hypothetical protein
MPNKLLLLSPIRSVVQLVEHPDFIGRVHGRIMVEKIKYNFEFKHRSVAQLVEQLTLNQRAQGSNPCRPTKRDFISYLKPVNHLIYRLFKFFFDQFRSNNFKENVSKTVSHFLIYF